MRFQIPHVRNGWKVWRRLKIEKWTRKQKFNTLWQREEWTRETWFKDRKRCVWQILQTAELWFHANFCVLQRLRLVFLSFSLYARDLLSHSWDFSAPNVMFGLQCACYCEQSWSGVYLLVPYLEKKRTRSSVIQIYFSYGRAKEIFTQCLFGLRVLFVLTYPKVHSSSCGKMSMPNFVTFNVRRLLLFDRAFP